MSELLSIQKATLQDIGDKIRAKTGKEDPIPVADLASEIEGISTGVDTSSDTVTAETLLQGMTAHDASGQQVIGGVATYDGATTDGLSKAMPNVKIYSSTMLGKMTSANISTLSFAVPTISASAE